MGLGESHEGLVSHTEVSGEIVSLKLAGSAESGELDQLRAALEGVHDQATARHARVSVDLRELQFATSSCLKAFAAWLVRVSELPAGYPVSFLASPKHSWQRRSLNALAACAPDLVTVESDPG